MSKKIFNFLLLITLVTSSDTSVIKCNFEKISSSYTCNPITIEGDLHTENETTIINGTHLNGFKDEDVTYLRFNSPLTFESIPTKVFGIFPNIETFGLHSVNLSTILSNSIIDCFKLKSLHIDGNEKLIELSASFAEECSNMKNIYMSNNGIKIVDVNALKGLDNLNYLVLSKNHIESLNSTTFIHTPNLQFLFLDHNEIIEFHSDLFYSLRKLQILSVTFNHIFQISHEIFRNNPLLDQIFIDQNNIIAIEPEFFEEFPGKREYYEYRFYNNNCTDAAIIASKSSPEQDKSFDEEKFKICFDGWHELQSKETATTDIEKILEMDFEEVTFDISYDHKCRFFLNEKRKYTCVLENIDLVLSSVSGDHYEDFMDLNVTQLFFTNSTLSKVPKQVFEKFPNLEFLSVANTQMTIINEQTFGDCGKIKKIDASDNQIIKIVESSFKNCKELEVIDVSGNPLNFIDSEIFQYDPQLKHIILKKNNLEK